MTLPARRVDSTKVALAPGGEAEELIVSHGTSEWSLTLGPSTLIVVIATAVVAIATAVLTSATLVELPPYGPLGKLLVGDVNVEAPRVFKELQAQCPRHLYAAAGVLEDSSPRCASRRCACRCAS